MSSPAAIFHHGLRCTKVHKKSVVPAPSTTSLSALTSLASTTSNASGETLAPTQVVGPVLNNIATTNTHEMKVPPLVETTASQTSQAADAAPVIAATTAPTAATATTAFQNTPSASVSSLPRKEDEVNTNTSHDTTATLPSPVTSNLPTSSYSPTTPVPSILPTTNCTTSFTLVSSTTQSIPSQTHSLREPLASSDDNKSGASLRTILGSALGATAFLVLAALLCFLIFRYRRKSKGGQDVGGSEKPLQNGRQSPDSATGLYHEYRSDVSDVSDTSSNRSLYNYTPNVPLMPNYESHHQQPSHYSSPYSSSPENSPPLQQNAYPVKPTVRYPFLDYPQRTSRPSFPRRPASLPLSFASSETHRRPGIPFARDEGSMYGSDRSLGSTIILPGRSSSGSSFRRFSYGASAAELGLCSPAEPVTRVSTRSDPFDLEIPAKAMDRYSTATIARAQV